MGKKVLKIVAYTWGAASRDRKELAICRELGCDIAVMQRGGTRDKGRHEVLHGYDVYNYSSRPLGDAKILRPLNRFLSLFTWAHYARKFKPDIITGHDYIALFIGWLSTTFIPKKKRPKLVYDSHEYELGRTADRSRLTLWLIKQLEGFLIKRCEFTIIPCDSAADLLQKLYKCKRPVVVRNMPVYWHVDEAVMQENRKMICDKLGIPHDSFFLVLHGDIKRERHIDITINAAKKADVPLVLLGGGEADYIEMMKEHARKIGLNMLHLPAVPLEDIWKYAGGADAELIITPATCENHYYMLPNKVFESIQSLLPLIVADYPEMGGLTKKYNIGLTVDPTDESAIVAAIHKMRDDKELYARFKANLVKAKEELCWENEKKPLYEAYKKIICD